MKEPAKKRTGFGPALLVTAAFIGPGTVLTASSAGAKFGFSLIWAVLFSVFATIVLQEMAARLGIVSGRGLAESVHRGITNSFLKWMILALVLSGIFVGNSAYQTGNILGAATGLEILTNAKTGSDPSVEAAQETDSIEPEVAGKKEETASQAGNFLTGKNTWAILIGISALVLIWIGNSKILQLSLTILVALMGFLFLISAVASGPDVVKVVQGLIPKIPASTGESDSAWWFVVGLIGTTVVPYNLFLHASSAANQWADAGDVQASVRQSWMDTVLSVGIGGVITASLLITAAVTFAGGETLSSVKDIAVQLRPTLGSWAEVLFAIGLFSAGLTSSITAPIAAAYATAGCFGFEAKLSNPMIKIVASVVVVTGLFCALSMGGSPAEVILFAQVANGLLLPVMAGFLLYMVNQTKLMGGHRNGWVSNILGLAIVILTAVIAARQFNSAWDKINQLIGN